VRCRLGIDTSTRDDIAGALLAMPRHRLLHDSLDDLAGQRLRDAPCGATREHASTDHPDRPDHSNDDQQAERDDHMRRRDVAVLEARDDDLVDDEAHDHRRQHGARRVDRGAPDRGEEQLLVMRSRPR
jgi:hypothetical protein